MATIVQPYNPWREQLALTALGNVAGNIIGDIWARHKQSEENKKINAFRGQLQQDLGNIAGGNISLAPQNAPEGYNSDPWASAFHKNNTPLTQFDIGTGGIGKVPSIQDIAQNIDRLAATPRFSMLGQDAVGKVRNDFMQRAYADMFANAGDVEGRMNALGMGAADGFIQPQVLSAFAPFAREVYSPYTFQESDLGQNKVISAMNMHSGMSNPVEIMPVTVSPNTAATLANQRDIANIGADTQRYGYDVASRDRNRGYDIEENQQRFEQENPNLEQHVDADGHVWRINPRTGEPTLVTDANGNPITADTMKNAAISASLKSLDNDIRAKSDRLKEIDRSLGYAPDDAIPLLEEERERLNAELDEIVKRRNELTEQLLGRKPAPAPAQQATPAPPTTQTPQPTPSEQTSSFNALGAESADVPAIPESADIQPVTPVTPTPASADVTPTNPINTALGNVGADVRYEPGARQYSGWRQTQGGNSVTPPATAPAKPAPQPPARKKQTVRLPKIAVYDPSRDVNVSADMIKSLNELYSDYNKYKNQLQLPSTFQEFLDNCIRDGVKIRKE